MTQTAKTTAPTATPTPAADVRAFPRYPAYRDSGVPWLGAIPAHWDVKRIKYVAQPISKKLDLKPDDLLYLGLENIESQTGRLLLDATQEEVESTVAAFQEGDVLFGKLRPYLAKVALASFRGVCSTEILVLRPRAQLEAQYLAYRLLSDDFIRLVDSFTYGTKMPRANGEQIGAIKLGIPPLAEQRAIAGFLDRETARIDALVAAKRRLIELLREKRVALISRAVTRGLDASVPLRESGVPWLGAVPAHWHIVPLKYVSVVQAGITLGKDYRGRDVVTRPYLRVANVQDGYLDLSDIAPIVVPVEDVARYELRSGDVLMTEGGDPDKLGRGYVWHGQIEGCLHQNHIFAVRPNTRRLDPRFLASLLSSYYGKTYFATTGKQTTNLATTNSTTLGNFAALLPPLKEQQEILRYLDSETAKLDALAGRIEEQIARLREYRTALVAAAVTGAIDVRGQAAASDDTDGERVIAG